MWPFKPKETDNPHVNSLVDWLCDMAVYPEMWGFRSTDWLVNENFDQITISTDDRMPGSNATPGATKIALMMGGELRVYRTSYSVKDKSGNFAFAFHVIPITGHQRKRLKTVVDAVFATMAIQHIISKFHGLTTDPTPNPRLILTPEDYTILKRNPD